jgi:hypothetical protein
MGSAYYLETWSNLYFMLGTSSAGLVGLLFIVTSLHLDKIRNNQVLRRRANHRTIYLFLLLIEAVLVLMPQPIPALGVEIVAISMFGMVFPLGNIYRFCFKGGNTGKKDDWAIMRAVRYILAFLVAVAGGATLIRQPLWGMYLVTASYVALLILIALNAWTIMFTFD